MATGLTSHYTRPLSFSEGRPLRITSSVRVVLIALALIALYRVASLLLHDPMLALANNYDQIRYTGCYDVGPIRPGVPAWHSNPHAPLSLYGTQPIPEGNCYWSTDLLFGAPVAMAWRIAEWAGGPAEHSVRTLGALRLAAWLLVAVWVTASLCRSGRPDVAAAHLLALAVVAADPVNTLYLNTFYAEAGALFGLYLALAGAVVCIVRPGRVAFAAAATGAALLAGSKFQHAILPLLLALGLILAHDRRMRRAAVALLLGGLAGGAVQLYQGTRAIPLAEAIAATNRVNFVLTTVLPNVADAGATVARLGLPPACAELSGKSIYQLQEPVETLCPGLRELGALPAWGALLAEPRAWFRAMQRMPPYMLWIPDYLGIVEGVDGKPLPAGQFTLSRWIDHRPLGLLALFGLPWLVWAATWILRAGPLARGFAGACAIGSVAAAGIALFGDGYVELGKHAHLTFSLALASLAVPAAGLVRQLAQPRAIAHRDAGELADRAAPLKK